ncbi:hypothetical protein JZ751_003155 [Albula glossodonta]|uniref:Uncharacterized protein n=1 Tax=Albula glossodonta TaxID=121402 RepID=A0A8T2NK63_9TELE|nr:hypothetical protein JZ751_003155 [Albula glossodonta]
MNSLSLWSSGQGQRETNHSVGGAWARRSLHVLYQPSLMLPLQGLVLEQEETPLNADLLTAEKACAPMVPFASLHTEIGTLKTSLSHRFHSVEHFAPSPEPYADTGSSPTGRRNVFLSAANTAVVTAGQYRGLSPNQNQNLELSQKAQL